MALSGEGSARIDLNNTVTITQRSSFPTICASLEDVCLSTGKWYYEILIVEAGLAQFGWGDRDFEPSSESGDGTGDDEHSWAYDGHRTSKWHDGSTTWGKSWSSGQVVGCAVDLDNRKMYVVFEREAREFRIDFSFSRFYSNVAENRDNFSFSRFYYVTQITRISLTHTTRKSLENATLEYRYFSLDGDFSAPMGEAFQNLIFKAAFDLVRLATILVRIVSTLEIKLKIL